MVDSIRRHRSYERHLVYSLCKVGEQFRYRPPALPVLLERPWAGHDLLRAVQRAPFDFERSRLPVILQKPWFRIEHVDGARSATDVDEDDVLCLGREMGWLRLQIVERRRCAYRWRSENILLVEQPAQRHSAEPTRRFL